jgi:hypothetical protein
MGSNVIVYCKFKSAKDWTTFHLAGTDIYHLYVAINNTFSLADCKIVFEELQVNPAAHVHHITTDDDVYARNRASFNTTVVRTDDKRLISTVRPNMWIVMRRIPLHCERGIVLEDAIQLGEQTHESALLRFVNDTSSIAPPDSYACHRCGKRGHHWIRDCTYEGPSRRRRYTFKGLPKHIAEEARRRDAQAVLREHRIHAGDILDNGGIHIPAGNNFPAHRPDVILRI